MPFYGYGMRMFPFADKRRGMMQLRLGQVSPTSVLVNLPKLWAGSWFPEGILDFHASEVTIRYDRPVPFQVAGDAAGYRDQVTFGIAPEPVELVERAHGFSMFGLHADACSRGTLPDDRLPLCLRRAVGKAVVFARHDLFAHRSKEWLWSRDVADVPRPGTLIRRGEPVCTVFAEAPTPRECYAGLVRRAARIYAEVDAWG